MSLRLPAGRAMRAVLEPALAARLPKAEAGKRVAAEAATLIGLFGSPLGHGAAAHLCAMELRAAGIDVAEVDVSAAVGAPVESIGETTTADAKPNDGAAILMMNPDTSVHALSRGAADLVRGRRVIGYWVWELETPPPHWRVGRGLVHEIWTPSTFSAAAARAAFDVPVTVIPHPSALLPPPQMTPARRAAGRLRIGASTDEFVVFQSFSLASSLERKNPLGAIAAFRAAFNGDPSARLVIRMSQADRYPQAAQRLRAAAYDAGPTVMLIDEPAGLDELHALYAACDAYISLHRSEGFGLNLAEAMLAERAVIATAWSGNLDFMDAASAALIPAKLIPVRDPQRVYTVAGARWAEPDHDAAVAALRTLRDDPAARAALAKAGAEKARALLKGGAAARALRMDGA